MPTGPRPSHQIHDGAAMAAAIVASGARTRRQSHGLRLAGHLSADSALAAGGGVSAGFRREQPPFASVNAILHADTSR